MIINQFDIIRTSDSQEINGQHYNHVLITYPCDDEESRYMSIVDAMPCDKNGENIPDGYQVGVPTDPSVFMEVVGNTKDNS